MIQKNNKLQEGLDSVNRMKLLMSYDASKTLNENLIEQSVIGAPAYGVTTTPKPPQPPKLNKFTPEQLKYQKENPHMVWDPNALDETKPFWNQQGKINYPKGAFVPLTPENVGLRGVPFGFSPAEYPEYLKKVKEINKKYPKEETKIYDPTTWFDSDVDDKREKLLSDLKKEYYHPEFWKGITKQDYLNWKKSKTNLSNEKKKAFVKQGNEVRKIKDEMRSQYKTSETMPRSDRMIDVNNKLLKNIENQRVNAGVTDVKTKYDVMNQYIDTLFEYEPGVFKEMDKSALQKLWDKYGLVGELVFWLAVDWFSASMATWVTGPRQAYIFGKLIAKMGGSEKVAAIIRFMGTSGIPVAIGVDDIIRNNTVTENSILYFMFATLPYAHKFYGISKPTEEVCSSIIKKMSKNNLKTAEGLSIFIKGLNETEKSLVRKVLTMDKKTIESGIKETLEGVSKSANKKIVNVGKSAGKTLGKNKVVSKILKTLLIDVTSIHIVQKIALELGITLDDVKEKELIKLLDTYKDNPEYRSYLMKNAYFLMKENPTWEISKIIDKTKEKSDLEFYNKNQDEREKTDLETIDTAKKLGFSVIDRMIDPKTGELMKN
jgi:hypothetical protein